MTITPWPQAFVEKYRAANVWQDKPLTDILIKAQTSLADKTALIDGDRAWTYQQLYARAMELASELQQQGIGVGDKVVVQLVNCGEFFEVMFALLSLGAIPILALPSHRQKEITYFCSFSQAKAYIVGADLNGFDGEVLVQAAGAESPGLLVWVVTEFNKVSSPKINIWSAFDGTTKQAPLVMADLDPMAVALLQLSGGTTNVPKLIPRTHNDYYYSILQSNKVCEFSEATVYLAVLPVAHNFPLSSPGTLGTLAAGGTVVLARNGAPDTCFALIAKHKVTVTALVPPLAITWLNSPAVNSQQLASLQLLQVGGAKLAQTTAQKIEARLHCRLQQVFGMAEGLVNYTRLNDDPITIACTQGKPMSEFDEVLIVDDNDQALPTGEVGHLLTRGPYTIRGYFNAPEHNREAFTADGYYRTGDLACLTAKGYLQVEGRAKDQVNRGGEKISAAEVEELLLRHPDIEDAALVAVADDFLGERACAALKLKAGVTQVRLPKIKQYLRAQGLAEYKLPDQVVVFAEFPKTQFGKVSKQALRDLTAKATVVQNQALGV